MRLRKERIAQICRKMADRLEALEGVEVLGDRQALEHHLTEAFLDDLAMEDELEQETHQLLTLHLRGKPRDSVNYAELFRKAKAELARKKGVVLTEPGTADRAREGDEARPRRLPQARIKAIVSDALERLDEEGVAKFRGRISATQSELERVVLGDMRTEDEIVEEARRFILRMKNGPPDGSAQFEAMLLKKKEELATRRGYVL